jgi:hypothetical protein
MISANEMADNNKNLLILFLSWQNTHPSSWGHLILLIISANEKADN